MAAKRLLPSLSGKLVSGVGAMAFTSIITSAPIYDGEPPRKSIYDDIPSPPSKSTSGTISNTPTPTDRLAEQIRYARLALHSRIVTTQHSLDSLFDRFVSAEHNVASTVASVAPPRTSHEELIPGGIYVAVSTMAGAIVTRNRMFPIRALTPLAVGIGAAWYFLPETTRNVADLAWVYEKKVPQVAETHLATRQAVQDGWKVVEGSVIEGRKVVEGSVAKGRSYLEEWVKKH